MTMLLHLAILSIAIAGGRCFCSCLFVACNIGEKLQKGGELRGVGLREWGGGGGKLLVRWNSGMWSYGFVIREVRWGWGLVRGLGEMV